MRSVSLRRTAIVWMTSLLAGVGLSAMAIAFVVTRQEADEFLDNQLRQVALNAGLAGADAEAPRASDPDPEDQIAITIWQGDRLVRSDIGAVATEGPPGPGYADVALGHLAWRSYAIRRANWTVQAAQRQSVRTEFARAAAIGATAPIVIVIPLSWLVLGWAIDRTLRRLDAFTRAIAASSAAASDPLPSGGVPAELVPLVESMNGLIARLRTAIEAQRRFVADAAHELRTPLAALQIQAGNLPTDSASAAARGAIRDGVNRAGDLVDRLLALARLDESDAPRSTPLDLVGLALDALAEQAPLADEKGVELAARIECRPRVCGAEAEIRSLVANLVQNAVRYTPSGGSVELSLCAAAAGAAVLEVVDTGPGLPSGSEHRIFDRFYRAAPANQEGSGLGLAIARRVAERHGIFLTVRNRKDAMTGVVARAVLPAAHSVLILPR